MKIVKNRVFRTKVLVELPSEDGFEVQSFIGMFKALSQDELEGRRVGTNDEMKAFYAVVLIGWDGLTDDLDGKDEPFLFSPENRDALLQDVFIMRGVHQAYIGALAGAKRGN